MSDIANVKVRTRVEIVSRTKVLTTVISEYARAFGAKPDCIESIKKGIGERQIIKRIYLSYFNGTKFVGRITMEIDWILHRVLVNSDDGKEFKLRTDCSVMEQLDAASIEIVNHVKRMKKECGVTNVKSNYDYVEEYSHNPAKNKEAESFLNHSPDVNFDSSAQSTEGFKTHISFISDKLKELKITVEC